MEFTGRAGYVNSPPKLENWFARSTSCHYLFLVYPGDGQQTKNADLGSVAEVGLAELRVYGGQGQTQLQMSTADTRLHRRVLLYNYCAVAALRLL